MRRRGSDDSPWLHTICQATLRTDGAGGRPRQRRELRPKHVAARPPKSIFFQASQAGSQNAHPRPVRLQERDVSSRMPRLTEFSASIDNENPE